MAYDGQIFSRMLDVQTCMGKHFSLNAAAPPRSRAGRCANVARGALRSLEGWEGRFGLHKSMAAIRDIDVYLAGGVVRDAVWGHRPVKDFDLFVQSENFEPFLHELGKFGQVEFGPFGSPRWHPATGGTYADVISIERFNNGVEKCQTISDALRQFDFTANAIAVSLRTGELYDPLGGVADILEGVMKAVRFDYPNEPISPHETLTRLEILWFRLTHYAHELGLRPDQATAIWLSDNERLSERLSRFSESFFPPKIGQFS
jgi:hypothetical protein